MLLSPGVGASVENGEVRTDSSGRIRPLPGVICNAVLTDTRICNPQPGPVLDLLAGHGLSASAAVMIGDRESDRRCAEAAWLARFIWARGYFGWT